MVWVLLHAENETELFPVTANTCFSEKALPTFPPETDAVLHAVLFLEYKRPDKAQNQIALRKFYLCGTYLNIIVTGCVAMYFGR
jgi:hypothetical protein